MIVRKISRAVCLIALLCLVTGIVASPPSSPAPTKEEPACFMDLARRLHDAAEAHMAPHLTPEQIDSRWRSDPVIRNLYRAIAKEAVRAYSEGGICK